MSEIPSLEFLENKRIGWLEEAISNGVIDACIRVAEAYGKDVEYPFWSGLYKEWEQDNVKVNTWREVKEYSPAKGDFMEKVTVKVHYQDVAFAFVVMDEGNPGIGKNEFFVPGRWTKAIERWDTRRRREQEKESEESDLKRRLYLAKILQLT